MTGRRTSRWVLTAIVAPVVFVAGCTVSTNGEPVELSTDLFDAAQTTTTTSTTTPSTATKSEDVYLLEERAGSTSLQAVPREVDIDAGVQEILGDLFTNRPDVEGEERPDEIGLTSAIPETAELVSATISPATSNLIVDVRGLFGGVGIQGPALRDALAQIVWTATDEDAVQTVSFQNDGNPVPAATDNGETTDQPVNRSNYSAQR